MHLYALLGELGGCISPFVAICKKIQYNKFILPVTYLWEDEKNGKKIH